MAVITKQTLRIFYKDKNLFEAQILSNFNNLEPEKRAAKVFLQLFLTELPPFFAEFESEIMVQRIIDPKAKEEYELKFFLPCNTDETY